MIEGDMKPRTRTVQARLATFRRVLVPETSSGCMTAVPFAPIFIEFIMYKHYQCLIIVKFLTSGVDRPAFGWPRLQGQGTYQGKDFAVTGSFEKVRLTDFETSIHVTLFVTATLFSRDFPISEMLYLPLDTLEAILVQLVDSLWSRVSATGGIIVPPKQHAFLRCITFLLADMQDKAHGNAKIEYASGACYEVGRI